MANVIAQGVMNNRCNNNTSNDSMFFYGCLQATTMHGLFFLLDWKIYIS